MMIVVLIYTLFNINSLLQLKYDTFEFMMINSK